MRHFSQFQKWHNYAIKEIRKDDENAIGCSAQFNPIAILAPDMTKSFFKRRPDSTAAGLPDRAPLVFGSHCSGPDCHVTTTTYDQH
jgi:hypothetical protein